MANLGGASEGSNILSGGGNDIIEQHNSNQRPRKVRVKQIRRLAG